MRQAGPGAGPFGRRDRVLVLPLPRPSARHLAEQRPPGCGPSGPTLGSVACSQPLTLAVHRAGRLVMQNQAGAGDRSAVPSPAETVVSALPLFPVFTAEVKRPCRPVPGSLSTPRRTLSSTTRTERSEVSGPSIFSSFFFFFNTLYKGENCFSFVSFT